MMVQMLFFGIATAAAFLLLGGADLATWRWCDPNAAVTAQKISARVPQMPFWAPCHGTVIHDH